MLAVSAGGQLAGTTSISGHDVTTYRSYGRVLKYPWDTRCLSSADCAWVDGLFMDARLVLHERSIHA
jgi:hypothetical protein